MIFETDKDFEREQKAIKLFVSTFGGTFSKLGPFDVDYKVFDKEGKLVAYVEVKGRVRTIRNAYPLPVSAAKLTKLAAKRLAPVIIWACDDGIIYSNVNNLEGTVKWGGREPRPGAAHDAELMVYYDKQKSFKYVRYPV
jgi:hypothetical protein